MAALAVFSSLSLSVALAVIAGTGLGLASALTMHAEVVAQRRLRSADRVQMARERRDESRRAAAEHIEFADMMASRVNERQAELERIRGEIEGLQIRLTEASTARKVVESERDALREQLSSARAELVELQSQLAAAQDGEFQAQAALLAMEQKHGARRSA